MEKLRQSRPLQQFWNVAGAAPIRVKVLGIVLGVIILLGGFVILQMRAVLTTTLLDEIGQQGVSLSEHIAELAETRSLPDDRATLRALLEGDLIHYSSHTHNTVVAYIALYMADQSLVVGAMPDLPPVPATDSSGPVTRVLVSGQILEIVDFLGDTQAQIRIGLSTVNIQQIVNTVTFQLLTITLIMIAVGFAAAFFLTWILTRPLLELVNATHDVARGDFSRRVARWANDEIGALATAFNSMTESLEQADTERTERETLRRRYVNGVIAAQENERQRIARELHDSTGQSLTSLLIGLQNLKQSQSDEELNHQIDDLRSTISATLDDVRTMSWRLRPSALDDLGLISALQHYIDDYRERYQYPGRSGGQRNRGTPAAGTRNRHLSHCPGRPDQYCPLRSGQHRQRDRRWSQRSDPHYHRRQWHRLRCCHRPAREQKPGATGDSRARRPAQRQLND